MTTLSIPQKNARNRLLDQATAIIDTCEAEDREMTPDEEVEFRAATIQVRAIHNGLEPEPRGNPIYGGQQPSNALSFEPVSFNEPQSRIVSHSGIKLQAFKNTAKGREEAHTAGRFLAATFLRHGPSMQWCADHGVRYDVLAALGGGINTGGGALVPDEMSRTIIELMEVYGAFRQNCDNIPMTSDSLTVPRRVGGLTAFYSADGTDLAESDASWDNVQFIARKLGVFTRMSSEISEDAVTNMGDKMTSEIGIAFAFKEDSVGFNGAGTSIDGGQTGVLVTAIDSKHTMAKVAAASGHNLLTEIDGDDLLNLMAALPNFAKAGAKWYCSPTALAVVFNAIKIAGGGNTMEILSNAVQPSFLGYPIVVTPVMADGASTDYTSKVMIAFGNLAQAATIATRRDIRVAVSDQRYFELDQIAIKGTLRHSIVAHDLGSTTVKSPLVVLTGN